MAPKSLELDHILLTSVQNKLKLSAVAVARFNIPTHLLQLSIEDTIDALESGELWVSQGARCALDFKITLNGERVETGNRPRLLESFGYEIRDAHLWPQLFLSPSLNIPNICGGLAPDFSIQLDHPDTPPISAADHRAWLLAGVEIRPPESVPYATIENIEIYLNFSTDSPELKSASKRSKVLCTPHNGQDTIPPSSSSKFAESFSLDEVGSVVGLVSGDISQLLSKNFNSSKSSSVRVDSSHAQFEGVVSRLSRSLSGSIAKIFDASKPSGSDPGSCPTSIDGVVEDTARSLSRSVSKCFKREATQLKTRTMVLEEEQQRKEEKNNSFFNSIQQSNDMLLSYSDNMFCKLDEQPDEEMLLSERTKISQTQEEQVKEEMLISFTPGSFFESEAQPDDKAILSQSTPSVASQLSSIITPPTRSAGPNLKRRAEYELDRPTDIGKAPNSQLYTAQACKLVEVAVCAIISGPNRRSKRLQDIRVEKPSPVTSLMKLAPTMFSPGFRESVAVNSRFLQTILQITSFTLPRNVQSPTLKRKLIDLANLPLLTIEGNPSELVMGSSEYLMVVAQTRIWAMMRKKLYDPSASKNLAWTSLSLHKKEATMDENESEDEMLLKDFSTAKLHDTSSDNEGLLDILQRGIYEDEDLEDLLADYSNSDDDLFEILDRNERELISVENETEDILLETYWEDRRADDILFGHEMDPIDESTDTMLLGSDRMDGTSDQMLLGNEDIESADLFKNERVDAWVVYVEVENRKGGDDILLGHEEDDNMLFGLGRGPEDENDTMLFSNHSTQEEDMPL